MAWLTLLGGYFTTHWTWHWIFYINLPVGIIALVVLAATLPTQSSFARHAIDYIGAAVLALTLASIVLVADLGGTVYSWTSPMTIGLIVTAVAGLIAVVLVERRAREPILPLQRDVRRRYIAAIVARAGVDLSPAAAWLLVQIERERGIEISELGRRGKCDATKLKAATTELSDKSLIAAGSVANVYQLTEAGCDMYNRLVTARREHLAELWPEWPPKKREEVAEILRRFARELIPAAEAA